MLFRRILDDVPNFSVDFMFEVWFFYALLSAIFFGYTTIVDKLMLEGRLNAFSYFVAYAPPAWTFCICVLLLYRATVFSGAYVVAFLAGLLSAVGYFCYVLPIRREEASRIAALTSLAPAFVALLAVFLVNEIFPATSYIGIILMILGSALISYKNNEVKKVIPFSMVLILIATNFTYGLEQTISKISLGQISFWQFLMMFMFGRFLVVPPGLVIPKVRKKFKSEVKELGRNLALTLASGSITWSLGIIFFFYSASLGPITLVSTTGLLSPLFTLLFAVLITKYLPKVLREEIDSKTVTLKLVAIILIIYGTYLILA